MIEQKEFVAYRTDLLEAARHEAQKGDVTEPENAHVDCPKCGGRGFVVEDGESLRCFHGRNPNAGAVSRFPKGRWT